MSSNSNDESKFLCCGYVKQIMNKSILIYFVLWVLPGNITFYSNDDTDEEDEDDEVGPVPDLLVATRHRKLRRTDTSVCMVVTPDHCLTPSKKKIIEEGIYQDRFSDGEDIFYDSKLL